MLLPKQLKLENIEKIEIIENDFTYFVIQTQDNIINSNKPDFFLNFSEINNLKLDGDLEVKQMVNINYRVAKLKDDLGFIFSENKTTFTLRKNY